MIKTYTIEEIEELYPQNSFCIHPVSLLNVPVHSFLWKHSNKLLIRTLYPETGKCLFRTYILEKNGQYKFITSSLVLEDVIERSKDIWDPKPVHPVVSREELALGMIEDTIISYVNKDKLDLLEKKHFCYVYVASDKQWHAYYPEVDVLLQYHTSHEKQNQNYLDFLNSDRLKQMRLDWDTGEVIV